MTKPVPRTIHISPDVYRALATRSEPFESPNETLRRILGVEEPRQSTRPMSAIDAAAKILEEAGKAMTAKELWEAAQKKGYWCSEGLTPEATIGAALYDDMKRNGTSSRFQKEGRARFKLREKQA